MNRRGADGDEAGFRFRLEEVRDDGESEDRMFVCCYSVYLPASSGHVRGLTCAQALGVLLPLCDRYCSCLEYNYYVDIQ